MTTSNTEREPDAEASSRTRPLKPAKVTATLKRTTARQRTKRAQPTKAARPGSQAAKILELLQRPNGASLQELTKATGWQPHSMRGFLSGTVRQKMALALSSRKNEDGERTYRIKT